MSFQSLVRSVFTSAALMCGVPSQSHAMQHIPLPETSAATQPVESLSPQQCNSDLKPTEDSAYQIIRGNRTLNGTACIRILQLSLILWELEQKGEGSRKVDDRSGLTGRWDAPTIQRLRRFISEVPDPESFLHTNKELLNVFRNNMPRQAYLEFLENMVTQTLPDRALSLSESLKNSMVDNYVRCAAEHVMMSFLYQTGEVVTDLDTIETAISENDPTLLIGDICESLIDGISSDTQHSAREIAIAEIIKHIDEKIERETTPFDQDGSWKETHLPPLSPRLRMV